MDMRKQALDEERKRREELEKRLQEETNRRQKLIEREVKLREKQRAQVREGNCRGSYFLLLTSILVFPSSRQLCFCLPPNMQQSVNRGLNTAVSIGYYSVCFLFFLDDVTWGFQTVLSDPPCAVQLYASFLLHGFN